MSAQRRIAAAGLLAALATLATGCGLPTRFAADPGLEEIGPGEAAGLPAGRRVAWTGVITDWSYAGGVTRLEVRAFPRRWGGRPDRDRDSTGRFRVRRHAYLDPVQWAPGREIAAAGALAGDEPGTARVPTVEADALRLWPERRPGLLPFGLRFGFEISN